MMVPSSEVAQGDACPACGTDYAPGAQCCRKCLRPRDSCEPIASDNGDRAQGYHNSEAASEPIASGEGSCAVCGCDYAPCASKCGLCGWPRGVNTAAETKAKAAEAKLRARLQSIITSTAAKAQADALGFEGSNRKCTEDAMAAVEDVVSQLMARLEKREGSGHTNSGANALPSFTSIASSFDAAWEPDTKECSVCATKLGRWRMKPRHHCRACGKCVCANCSPSMVKVSGKHLQRVCTPCVETVFSVGASSLSVARDLDMGSVLAV